MINWIKWKLYNSGIRRYCMQHDTLAWRWTHRDCCMQNRATASRVLRYVREPTESELAKYHAETAALLERERTRDA